MEFLGPDGRELAGDVRKEVEGDRQSLFLHGTDAFQDWAKCPLIEYTEEGQYLAAFSRLRPGLEESFPEWIAAIQVEFTGKTEAAWR